MKKTLLVVGLCLLAASCAQIRDSLSYIRRDGQLDPIQKVLFFPPVIEPEIQELQQPTAELFRSAITDSMLDHYRRIQVKFIDTPLPFNGPEAADIAKFSTNNQAQAVVIPHIKYVKMGLGPLVSKQVVVKYRLYNHKGDYLMETGYDTTIGNAKLRASATSSLKYGAQGCLRKLIKEIRNNFRSTARA